MTLLNFGRKEKLVKKKEGPFSFSTDPLALPNIYPQ
jgi:hypothetical protein